VADAQRYWPIGDYGFLSDCHSVALVSREGSIDWCCMPRVDSASVFGRLLDAERGGCCTIQTDAEAVTSRRYPGDSLVLETTIGCSAGEARILDCFSMRETGAYSVIGGNDGLLVTSDVDLERSDNHDLVASFNIRAGQRVRFSLQYLPPHRLDLASVGRADAAALDRGVKLADECVRRAPTRRWRVARDEIREAVERDGYDADRGVFVQSFGSKALDGALLLLPSVEFLPYDDPRMVRTTDAIRRELDDGNGLILRYPRGDDDLKGEEGAFVTCSFWLVECLARQGRVQDARELFDRVAACGSDLGLFSEEYDAKRGDPVGNYPQGLSHLSHIAAAVALARPDLPGAPG
jgi:GH15 family glucan-1,4-alpha-glucosidase